MDANSQPYYPEELENVINIADDVDFRHAPEDCTDWDDRCPEWAAAGRYTNPSLHVTAL